MPARPSGTVAAPAGRTTARPGTASLTTSNPAARNRPRYRERGRQGRPRAVARRRPDIFPPTSRRGRRALPEPGRRRRTWPAVGPSAAPGWTPTIPFRWGRRNRTSSATARRGRRRGDRCRASLLPRWSRLRARGSLDHAWREVSSCRCQLAPMSARADVSAFASLSRSDGRRADDARRAAAE